MLNRIYTLDYIYRDGDIDHRRYMLQINIDRFVSASARERDTITIPFHSVYHRDTKETLRIESNGTVDLIDQKAGGITVAQYSIYKHRVTTIRSCENKGMYWDFVDSDVDQIARIRAYSGYLNLDYRTANRADQCHILSVLRSVRKTNCDEPVDKVIEKERSLIPKVAEDD